MSLRRLATIVAVVGILALAAVALWGVTIDAHRWREPAAAALSRALGRDVRIEGPARLTVSLHPELVVKDLRVANPPGFDTPEFARAGEVRVATALLPLLRGEVRVLELAGRDIAVRLARAGDGRGNWLFDLDATGADARMRLDVHRVALEAVQIDYVRDGASRRVDLALLTADVRPGEASEFALRGRAADGVPFTARATGGPRADLGGPAPWPFEVQVLLPGSVLHGRGGLSGPLPRPALRLAFGAGTEDARAIARLLGLPGPPFGAAALAGELDIADGTAALKSFNGVLGATAVAGDVALDLRGARPKLAGRLAIPALDVRAIRGGAPPGGELDTFAEAYGALAPAAELDLANLALVDADLELKIAALAGIPGAVRDLNARVRSDAGRLVAPLAATIADARFDGEVEADASVAPPRLRARLAAREAPLGRLAELVFDVPYVAGTVRRFDLALDAAGNRPADLVRDLEARLAIAGASLTYGNFGGGTPVAMRLDDAEVGQRLGGSITGRLRGSLRGKPFEGRLSAGTVERILREQRTPFRFDGTSGSVRARLSGTLMEPTAATGPRVVFDMTAPRARELTPWLGFASSSDAPVAIRGTVLVRHRHVSLTGGMLVVGRTSVAGDLSWEPLGTKSLVKADLVAEVLAPMELGALAPDRRAARATLLEIPILPESLDFADSELNVRVKRVDGLPLELADLRFRGRMRDGELTASPFSLRVEGATLGGALAIDARGAVPVAAVWVAGEDVDLGPWLQRLRVARDVDARIGTLRVYADIRERRLADALDQSSLVATMEAGTLDFRDTNTRAAVRIAIDRGEVRADAGAPITAALAGTAGSLPVALALRTGRLRELFEPGERLPFTLNVDTPAATLAVGGTAVPQRDPDVALSVALKGDRLDALDELLETALPAWGPYDLSTTLRFARRGYQVDAMRLVVGESVLVGRGTLDTAAARPRFEASLEAERLQLDDFPVGTWSPVRVGGDRMTVRSARTAAAGGARRIHALMSREFLTAADGTLNVIASNVVSGGDELGRGRFAAVVRDGRATIGPIEIGSPAGAARGRLVYEPREHDVVVGVQLKIDRLEYGVLARRIRPDADHAGRVSVDLQLDATAPRLADAFATGSGRFDFAVWPERVTGGAFDLWTANMLLRLLPIIDRSASPMNCTVGHFDLEAGRLRSRRFVIDTVNARTEGAGTADFTDDTVDMRFVPRAKVPQFFSFAPAVELRGTFDDYRFTVRPADVAGAALRWAASPVTVPIERLTRERAPADGRDICANPGR